MPSITRGWLRAALLAVALLAIGARVCASAASQPTALTGRLRFFMCDDARCERPLPDAPGWSTYVVGPEGISGRVEHREGVGWAIVSFDLAPALAGLVDPALLITRPADAELATLNGQPAGGEGVIGPRYLAVPSGPRVLALPRGALRAGPNELALKVLFAEMNAQSFSGTLLLGERDRIALECETLRRPLIAAEAAFMSLFLVMIVFFCFLILRGVIRSDYVLFSAFLVLYVIGYLFDSHLVYLAGLASPWTEHLQAVVMRVLSLVVLALVTTISGRRFGMVHALFGASAAGLLLAVIVLPPLHSLQALDAPRKVLLGLLGVYYLYMVARALHERRPDAVPVFVGVAAYVVGSRLDLYWGIAARDYGTGVFALSMLYTITSRHARLRTRIEEISGRLLEAHEEERRRIARDIHDGVGQSVLALRLRLQMLAGKAAQPRTVAAETLPALAEEAGAIVDELRRTVLDLRPAAFETADLVTALRAYASTVAGSGGFALHFHEGREPVPDLDRRVRTHLFRIFQEMLTNVMRHARATRVDVSLHGSGGRLVLQVSDDGRGVGAGGGGGIGLETMRERAELLGGSLAVGSAPGGGTVVTAEIPLP
jgi:two-component system sensor histidine kinase UhpB